MFLKGKSGNPDGRPKGSENKVTKEIREAVTRLVNNNLLQLEEDLLTLETGDRIRLLIQLMEFVLPKQQRTSLVSENDTTIIWNEQRTCPVCEEKKKNPSWFDE